MGDIGCHFFLVFFFFYILFLLDIPNILMHFFVNNVVPSVSGELINSAGLIGLHCFCTTQK